MRRYENNWRKLCEESYGQGTGISGSQNIELCECNLHCPPLLSLTPFSFLPKVQRLGQMLPFIFSFAASEKSRIQRQWEKKRRGIPGV